MGVRVTKYETKNGKTRKVKTGKNGAAESTSGADNKNQTAGNSGKQGA